MERILCVHPIGILSGETPLPGRMPQSPGDPASPNDKICRRTKGRAVGPDGGGFMPECPARGRMVGNPSFLGVIGWIEPQGKEQFLWQTAL